MAAGAIAPLAEAARAGWREQVADGPYGPIRYVEAGTGPVLVLCHGFIGSAENFESWVPALSRRRHLLIPDLPGFGGSAPLPGRHTSRALAGQLRWLVDSLGIGRFEVGGLCLGAAVALELTAGEPNRVGRLILHTPLLAPPLVTRQFRLQALVATTPGVFTTIATVGRSRMVADLYRRVVVEGASDVDPRSSEVNFLNQLRAHPRAAREWLRDGMAGDFRRLVRGLRMPRAVLAAADDRLLRLDRLADFCAQTDGLTLDLLPAAGHGWTQEFMGRQVEVLQGLLPAFS